MAESKPTIKPDNSKNLVSLKDRTTSEQREIAKKGGIRSGEVRREKKLWKDEIAKRLKAEDFDEIIDSLIKNSKNDYHCFEVLRDTMGQKPVNDVNITNENTEVTISIGNAESKN